MCGKLFPSAQTFIKWHVYTSASSENCSAVVKSCPVRTGRRRGLSVLSFDITSLSRPVWGPAHIRSPLTLPDSWLPPPRKGAWSRRTPGGGMQKKPIPHYQVLCLTVGFLVGCLICKMEVCSQLLLSSGSPTIIQRPATVKPIGAAGKQSCISSTYHVLLPNKL